MEKGTYGYIDSYKKKYGIATVIFAVVIVAAAVAVYLIFGTVKHVAILVPIILSLPFAKLMLQWVVIAKFHSFKSEEQARIQEQLEGREYCIVLYDTALSSYEAISYASCLVIDQGDIYLLWGGSNDKKYDETKQREYIQGIIGATGYDYEAHTVHSVDELLESVLAAPISEADVSVKCDRLRKRMLDICV